MMKRIFFFCSVLFVSMVFMPRVSFSSVPEGDKVIALFSQTGNGKSRTGNLMLYKDVFPVGHGGTSVAIPGGCQVASAVPPWSHPEGITIVDTQGTSDSDLEKLDFHIFNQAFECMKKEVKHLNALVFVLSSNNPRYSRSMSEMVNTIKSVFRYSTESGKILEKESMCDNVALIVNRVPPSDWSSENEKGFKETASKLARDIQCQSVPVFFFGFSHDTRTMNGLSKFWEWLKDRPSITPNMFLFSTKKTVSETKTYAINRRKTNEIQHVPKQGPWAAHDLNKARCTHDESTATRTQTVYTDSEGKVLHAEPPEPWVKNPSTSKTWIAGMEAFAAALDAIYKGQPITDETTALCGWKEEVYDKTREFFP